MNEGGGQSRVIAFAKPNFRARRTTGSNILVTASNQKIQSTDYDATSPLPSFDTTSRALSRYIIKRPEGREGDGRGRVRSRRRDLGRSRSIDREPRLPRLQIKSVHNVYFG